MGENGQQHTQQPYLGSVRFFKHVILGTIALLIVIPTCLCIAWGVQNHGLKQELSELQANVQALQERLPADSTGEKQDQDNSAFETESPEYEDLFPNFYAPKADLGSVYTEQTVYLTFDDGPSSYTPEILAILERYNIKATFFVVGKTDEQSQQWMRDIVAAGHTLGMHSYTHEYRTIYDSVEAFLADMDGVYRLIESATGQAPTIFRFPGGSINSYNASNYQQLISEMVRRGFVYFDWNVTNGDASYGSPVSVDQLTRNALEGLGRTRAIVLMHDSANRRNTVAALPAIIEGYRNAGYDFAPLTPEVVPITYGYCD